MDPLVTVGMPFFNSERTLESALRSLLNQEFQSWEALVVDDGSGDRSVDVVRQFTDRRIRLLSHGSRKGLASRLNQTVQLGRGRFFARMDADDIAYPQRFRRQVEFLRAEPNVDLVGGEALVFRDDGSASGALRCSPTHDLICRRPWRGFNSLLHSTWMGKMSWFRANPFRDEFRKSQDRELLLRTYRRSTFACIPEILLGYRQESLSLKKILSSRLYFALALLRVAVETSNPVLLLGIFAQVPKAVVDVLAVKSGLGYRLLRHRAMSVSKQEIDDWGMVYRAVQGVFTYDKTSVGDQ